jgi:putative nucleotidyltransferase with HDIG domain
MRSRPASSPWMQYGTAMLRRFGWRHAVKPLLGLMTVIILTALIYAHMDYYQVGAVMGQFRAGVPAPHEIRASRPMTLVDLDETARLKEKLASEVAPVTEYDSAALINARADLDSLLTALYSTAAEHENVLRDKHFTREMVKDARRLPPQAQAALRAITQEVLGKVMTADADVEERLEARMQAHASSLLRARLPDSGHFTLAAQAIRAVLRPAWVVNETLTEKGREAVRATVKPVIHQYERGQVVVQIDSLITEEMLTQLKDAGLLRPTPLIRVAPIAALMLLGIFALGLYLRNFARSVYDNPRKLLLHMFLIIVSIGAHLIVSANQELEAPISLIAIPAGAMAIAGLLGVPVAIVSTLLMVVTVGLTGQHQYTVVLLTMGASLAGVMAISAIWPASRAASAVLILVGIDLLLLIIAMGLQPGAGPAAFLSNLARLALTAAAGGVGATIVAAGAIYILARPFGITTIYRLMELSNPKEPLLRRLMVEAPGTYHSSVMVANMAEAAADAIDADVLLTRAAALYHDIGKLKRPAFFVENQAPLGVENVHQRLSPKLSYLILTSHVRDGVELGKSARLPDEIISIIREHHGVTLAAYFYHRAVSEAGGQPVPEHEFRYPGPKPSTREAAVVMLSDSVQASVKALKEPTPTRIENMVREIITNRLDDSQLDDCALTLHDLRVIGEVFTRILSGLYTYTRVEYPVIKVEGARTRVSAHSEDASASRDAALGAPGS